MAITCLASHELTIFCGLKSGAVLVEDQNILGLAVLRGHSREVLSLAVSAELLVSVARDQQIITWSVRHKVGSLTSPSTTIYKIVLRPNYPV